MLWQVDWSGRCGDSCGISVTDETPQKQVEEAQRTPRGKRSTLERKSTPCSTATKFTKTAFLKNPAVFHEAKKAAWFINLAARRFSSSFSLFLPGKIHETFS
ncbi:hypothetical protein BIV59_05915 [Bacillus sp. MUM 13]|nr:hypothetical protein BIV59_05915 [Bacillus sp. MUM 13]